jgi:hypothetical protein
MKYPKDL